MANPFDDFDTPSAGGVATAPAPSPSPAPASPQENPFDSFDAPKNPFDSFDAPAAPRVTAQDLAQQDHSAIFQHAAQNPEDFETAYQATKIRDARPFMTRAGETLKHTPTIAANAVKGFGNFLGGLVETPLHWAEGKAPETKLAENTLAAQNIEGGTGQSLSTVGRFLDSLDPDTWLYETPEMKEQQARLLFQQRVQQAKNEMQLAQGRPLNTGLIAGIYHAAGQQPSEEVGPEALQQYGVPQADPATVARMSAAADPMTLALSAAPGLPGAAKIGGRITQGVGAAAEGIGKGAEFALDKASHVGTVAKLGGGAAAAYYAYNHPEEAAGIGGALLAAKGLGKLGSLAKSQGAEMATGIPSALTTRAATAEATGKSAFGANLQRAVGDSAAHAATTAVGMAPLNAVLSEGDTDKFAESTAGAATFGGALGVMARNRPMMVEAIRPHLQSEGARALAEAGEGNDPLAIKSAAYVMSLSEEARDRVLESIGALQGLPTDTPNGQQRAKLYVLNDSDYRDVLAQKFGMQQAAMGGGRGFYIGDDGAAYVNGDYNSGLDPSELGHTVGHEFGGHAAVNIMQAMGSKGGQLYTGLIGAARDALMPGGRPTADFYRFVKNYNQAFDPSGRTQRLDFQNPESIEEFLAEQAGQLMAAKGAGELALPKTIQDKISDGLGRYLGKVVGVDTDKVGTPTHFGREEVGKLSKLVQDTLGQVVGMKLRGGAEIHEPAKTDTTRIAELQATLNTPRPKPGSPLEEVRQWISDQKAARAELSSLQQGQIGSFPASGTPPIAPSAPQAPTAPAPAPTPSRASVAAALRLNGIPSAEAQQWAQQAQGATVEEMVLDALKRRAGQKFPSQPPTPTTPGAQTSANQPPVFPPSANTPTPNGSTGTPPSPPNTSLPPSRTISPPEPVAPVPTPARTQPARPTPPSREAVDALVASAEAKAVAAEKKPNTAAAQKRVHDAKVNAVLDAIGDDPNGIHKVTMPDGSEKRVGDFDPENPYHQALADLGGGLSGPALDSLTKMQDAKGQTRFIRYRSALSSAEGEGGAGTMDVGMENRRAEYANDPASERTEGTIQHKVIIPVQTTMTKEGKPQSTFFVLDNLLHNAESVREFMKDHPELGNFPYANEANLLRDAKVYADNHAHGWKGDGSATMKRFPDSDLPTQDLNYQAETIPKDRFDVLNMMMHDEQAGKTAARVQEVADKQEKVAAAKTDKERDRLQGVLDRTITRMKTSQEGFALGDLNNPWVDRQTGETNELRAKLKAAGFDTNDALKSPFETLSPEHILDVSDKPIPMQEGDIPTVRPTGFTTGAEGVAPMGNLNAKAVRAGFLPDTAKPQTSEEFHDNYDPTDPETWGPHVTDEVRKAFPLFEASDEGKRVRQNAPEEWPADEPETARGEALQGVVQDPEGSVADWPIEKQSEAADLYDKVDGGTATTQERARFRILKSEAIAKAKEELGTLATALNARIKDAARVVNAARGKAESDFAKIDNQISNGGKNDTGEFMPDDRKPTPEEGKAPVGQGPSGSPLDRPSVGGTSKEDTSDITARRVIEGEPWQAQRMEATQVQKDGVPVGTVRMQQQGDGKVMYFRGGAKDSRWAAFDPNTGELAFKGREDFDPSPEQLQNWQDAARKFSSNKPPVEGQVFLRYGDAPKGGRSTNFLTGNKEPGTSVYDVEWNPFTKVFDLKNADHVGTAMFHIMNGVPPTIVQGDVVGKGSDGEPVIKGMKKVLGLTFDKERGGYVPNENNDPVENADVDRARTVSVANPSSSPKAGSEVGTMGSNPVAKFLPDTGKPEEGETPGERLMREAEVAGLAPSLETTKGILRGDTAAMDKLRKMIMDKTGRPARFLPGKQMTAKEAARSRIAARSMPQTMFVASRGKYEGNPPIPFYAASTEDYAKNFGDNVRNVTVAPKKTLDLTSIDPREEQASAKLKDSLKSAGISTEGLSIYKDDEPPQAIMRNVKEVAARAKAAGYDSIRLHEYVEGGGDDTTMLIVSDSALHGAR